MKKLKIITPILVVFLASCISNNEIDIDMWFGYKIKDNHAYFSGEKIKEIDTKTLKVLWTEIYNKHYAKDISNVYFQGKIIKNSDIQTFEVLEEFHAKDKDNIYYKSSEIEEIDYVTFEILGGEYSKDKSNIYWQDKKLDNIDISTFKIIDNIRKKLSKDKKNVYFRWEILEWADSETFELLDYPYAKDKNKVYFIYWSRFERISKEWKFEIKLADPQTFIPLWILYGKDKNNCYKNWEKVDMSECDDFLEDLEK